MSKDNKSIDKMSIDYNYTGEPDYIRKYKDTVVEYSKYEKIAKHRLSIIFAMAYEELKDIDITDYKDNKILYKFPKIFEYLYNFDGLVDTYINNNSSIYVFSLSITNVTFKVLDPCREEYYATLLTADSILACGTDEDFDIHKEELLSYFKLLKRYIKQDIEDKKRSKDEEYQLYLKLKDKYETE